MALLISEEQTRKLIDMSQALKVVEQMFRDRALGKVRIIPRQRLRGANRQLNFMAAWQSDSDMFCIRAYVGSSNTITLYSGGTGKLLAIFNARYLSALRTGAASGVAARYLAPANAEVLGLIGIGRQARFQVEAIACSRPLREVTVYGRNPKKAGTFVRSLGRELSIPVTAVSSLQEVEARADILVVATDATEPVVGGERIKEDVLVVSMGANGANKHEVSTDLIRRMDLVVTDDLPTARSGSGDLIAACDAGMIRWENVFALEKILANGLKGTPPKRIFFQSNGIPDEDLAVARYVFEQARRKRVKARKVAEI